MNVETPRCDVCLKTSMIEVREEDYDRWRSGWYIQAAFPEMRPEDRETLLTGTHPACWDILMGARP